jgi:2,4-dienoyl-CoA reductase-like NADH-dependent reductase (Old Yellow Enzyme family)
VAPSAIQPLCHQLEIHGGHGPYRIPRDLHASEVEEIVASFASAARGAPKMLALMEWRFMEQTAI